MENKNLKSIPTINLQKVCKKRHILENLGMDLNFLYQNKLIILIPFQIKFLNTLYNAQMILIVQNCVLKDKFSKQHLKK